MATSLSDICIIKEMRDDLLTTVIPCLSMRSPPGTYSERLDSVGPC
jgi:hypothetical protein